VITIKDPKVIVIRKFIHDPEKVKEGYRLLIQYAVKRIIEKKERG